MYITVYCLTVTFSKLFIVFKTKLLSTFHLILALLSDQMPEIKECNC
jgi:hypothetical protein